MKKLLLIFSLSFATCSVAFSQMDYVEVAAANGDLSAQRYLAEVYAEGKDGKKKDLAIAYKWLKAAADQGDNQSMHELALWDKYVHGGEWQSMEEIRKCQELLKRPAANKYAPSEAFLGGLYLVDEKYFEAFSLLKDAADQGCPDGCFCFRKLHL